MSSSEMMALNRLRSPVIGLRTFSTTLLTPSFAMKNEIEPISSRIVESGAFSSFAMSEKIPSTTSLRRALPLTNCDASASIVIPSAFASGRIAFS